MAKPATIQTRSLWENIVVAFNWEAQQSQTRQVDTLLTIFRYASMIRFIISVILWLVITYQAEEQRLGHVLTIFDALLLTIYLFATPLHAILKDRYLPIALVWATIVPLLTSTLTMYLFFTTPIPEAFQIQIGLVENFVIFYSLGLTVPVLLIPLLIVSWLYKRQIIIVYLLTITLFDVLVIVISVPIDDRIFVALALIVFRLLILGFVGLIVNYLVTIQRTQAKALRDYATTREHLIASQERNRLARELHDTLAHSLAAVTVQLEAVKVIWQSQPERAKQLVDESAETVRSGLQETRRALQALRAETLESIGFSESIYELAKTTQARYGFEVTVSAMGDFTWLTNEQEHVLYRIVQEALQNGAKHADAKHIQITVQANDNALRLSIVDDGIGFDPKTLNKEGHFGVQGMHERTRLIGAKLTINSQIGQGTTIKVNFERTYDAHPYL
ncbi:MAG: sensor histidine kinase [Chloroflexota bacterium]